MTEEEGMSEFGFSVKQAKALKELLGPIMLQVAAIKNLLIEKGLITAEEVEREIARLDKAVILKRLERDLQTREGRGRLDG